MKTKTSKTDRTSYDELLAQFKPRLIGSELQYRRVMRQIDDLMRMNYAKWGERAPRDQFSKRIDHALILSPPGMPDN